MTQKVTINDHEWSVETKNGPYIGRKPYTIYEKAAPIRSDWAPGGTLPSASIERWKQDDNYEILGDPAQPENMVLIRKNQQLIYVFGTFKEAHKRLLEAWDGFTEAGVPLLKTIGKVNKDDRTFEISVNLLKSMHDALKNDYDQFNYHSNLRLRNALRKAVAYRRYQLFKEGKTINVPERWWEDAGADKARRAVGSVYLDLNSTWIEKDKYAYQLPAFSIQVCADLATINLYWNSIHPSQAYKKMANFFPAGVYIIYPRIVNLLASGRPAAAVKMIFGQWKTLPGKRALRRFAELVPASFKEI